MSWIDKLKSSFASRSPEAKSAPEAGPVATPGQQSETSLGGGFYNPFKEPHTNFLYNLLFCDDIKLFETCDKVHANEPWPTLLAECPDRAALLRLGMDETQEGRVRALACGRLRAAGILVPSKKIFGVVVEVQLQQGLDVLATFSEGGVRYLNQSGKIAIFEGSGHPLAALASEVVKAAQPIVDRIGPWKENRLAPPKAGHIRMTFIVSDGLYFGEGPFNLMQSDSMAGPLIGKAVELLKRVVEVGVN